ncbi:hypothetical protein B0H14DRAFT_2714153 [Mycena olivaceomarginata]|nr:hypothetical protein B0H14DRAFT_2714153 [Mycena olivaceomarginata]
MVSLIESTTGMWLVGLFLQSMLHGMGLLQGFLYFVWYSKDNWTVKGTVVAVLLSESIQMGAAFANAYEWLIPGFGNFPNLNIIHWQDMVQLTLQYLSTFIVQVHFARTIYNLHVRDIYLPIFIFLLALLSFGAGIGQVILATRLGEYSKLGEASTSATTILQAAVALTADIAITAGIFWRLNASRTGVQATNKILNFLIITAINRGVFTMLTAALSVILFLSKPGTFYFMVPLLLSNKFYMNSMLAMLNTREFAVGQAHGTRVVNSDSMPMFATSSANRFGVSGVNVSTVKETNGDIVSLDAKMTSF